jgi:hypothetical protein
MNPWIEFRESGNTLFGDFSYGIYRKFDESLSKNQSLPYGLRFTFDDKAQCERLLKRGFDTCTLFRVSTFGGWKKLFPEIKIEKL